MYKLNNLKIVPEDYIVQCARDVANSGEERNNFEILLEDAHSFRLLGLTPIFLCTKDYKDVFITSKEKLNKQYH